MHKYITLTDTQQTLVYLRGMLPVLAALGTYLWLRRYKGGRFVPLAIGFVAFIVIALPRRLLQGYPNYGWEHLLPTVLIAACTAALVEEPFRYLALRFYLRNYDTVSDAVCAGIGNACSDLILSAIWHIQLYRVSPDRFLSAGLYFTNVYEAYPKGGLPAELLAHEINTQGAPEAADFILGGIGLLAFHIAMSALVQVAVQRTNSRQFFPLAILLHILFNTVWSLGGTAVMLPTAAAICYFVYRIRQVHYRIEPDTIITIRMIFIPFK